MREFGSLVERLLCPGKIVDLDKAIAETRPCIPILRVLLADLLKDRHSLIASPVVGQLQRRLHVSVGKILSHWSVVRCQLVGDGENRQIIFPLFFLRDG